MMELSSILIGFWISRHIGRVENEGILKVKYVRNVYLYVYYNIFINLTIHIFKT